MGRVIWICGLSCAGKTTLAKALIPQLSGQPIWLDGDAMRSALDLVLDGYDGESRRRLALTYSRWAKLLADQGQTVVVSTISMFHEVFAWNRKNLSGYLEVFLDVPEEERQARDFKGIYKNTEGLPRRNVSGVDIPNHKPDKPDIHLLYRHGDTVQDYVQRILQIIAVK